MNYVAIHDSYHSQSPSYEVVELEELKECSACGSAIATRKLGSEEICNHCLIDFLNEDIEIAKQIAKGTYYIKK